MSPPRSGRESTGTIRKSVKSASYNDRLQEASERLPQIPRPGSHSKLLNTLVAGSAAPKSQEIANQRLTKLLLNVTVQQSLGPVHAVISPESKVSDLIKAAVEMYVREGRRPLLTETDPRAYELHYSQFSLDNFLLFCCSYGKEDVRGQKDLSATATIDDFGGARLEACTHHLLIE
ncbi:uncharacterized protein At4g22758-like isoform X2 [Aristolochia californica]|uniref:uncharacterized protein At4g22758-like isoform X2 n=1 Tax=Aristolochia californica TaxID=171875 RepID=UPI0035E3AE58